MKILILGTTSYETKMTEHATKLINDGHAVRTPAFDHHPELDDLGVCEYNRGLIRWAEEIHVFWDQRSPGFVFDFGMLFYAQKPIKIIYLGPKTLTGVLTKYEQKMKGGKKTP